MARSRVWIALAVLGGVALATSVSLNVILFQRGRQYYVDLNRTRLDPLGLLAFGSAGSASGNSSDTAPLVVFYGDSRAQNWPVPADAGHWRFENRGVGAQTTAQVLGRFEPQIVPLRPKVVVIEAGINDLKTIPLFPDQKQAIIQRCQANLTEIVQRSRARGATVILATIFPTGRVPLERRLFWSDAIGRAVRQVNAYLVSLQAEDVLLLDSGSILADASGQLRGDYREDELHVNAVGYAALNVRLRELLGPLER